MVDWSADTTNVERGEFATLSQEAVQSSEALIVQRRIATAIFKNICINKINLSPQKNQTIYPRRHSIYFQAFSVKFLSFLLENSCSLSIITKGLLTMLGVAFIIHTPSLKCIDNSKILQGQFQSSSNDFGSVNIRIYQQEEYIVSISFCAVRINKKMGSELLNDRKRNQLKQKKNTDETSLIKESIDPQKNGQNASQCFMQNSFVERQHPISQNDVFIYKKVQRQFQSIIDSRDLEQYQSQNMRDIERSQPNSTQQGNVTKFLPQTNEAQILLNHLSLSDLTDLLLPNAGIIQSKWLNPNGWVETICYGSGFAISKRVVLTCAHNIYSQRKGKACSKVVFAPNHKFGSINLHTIYSSASRDFLSFEQLKPGQTYITKTVSSDIALVFLSQDLPFNFFPNVGLETLEILQSRPEISVTGYPSKDYYDQIKIQKVKATRISLRGNVTQFDDQTIYHSAATDFGHSGSPLIIKSRDGSATIIGVHTHRSSRRSSAVNLSLKVLRKLILGQVNFALKHKDANIGIKFPVSIQREVLFELDGEIQEKVLGKMLKDERFQSLIDEPLMNHIERPLQIQKNEEIEDNLKQQQLSQKHSLRKDQHFDKDEIQQDFEEPPLEKLLRDEMKEIKYNLRSQYSQESQRQIYKFCRYFNKFMRFAKKLDGLLVNQAILNMDKHFAIFHENLEKEIFTLKEKLEKIGFKVSVSKFKSADEHIHSLNYYSQDQSAKIYFCEEQEEYFRTLDPSNSWCLQRLHILDNDAYQQAKNAQINNLYVKQMEKEANSGRIFRLRNQIQVNDLLL